MILADTSVLSLVFRRQRLIKATPDWVELASLIVLGNVGLIGAIRQELLSGIRTDAEFIRLQDDLRVLVEVATMSEDYVTAARFANACRRAGIQGSNVDFLICAVGHRTESAIFTTDLDFRRFATVLPIKLHTY